MDRLRNFSLLIVTFAITGFLSVACDSGTQEPEAPATKPMDIEHSAGDAGATAGESEAMMSKVRQFDAERYPAELPEGVTAAIPDNFPKEFPIYPGSEPSQGRGVEVDGVPMSAVQLLSNDSPAQVFEFYLDELVEDGWEIQDNEAFQGKTAVTATKGKCTATMFAAPTDAGSGSDIFVVTEC